MADTKSELLTAALAVLKQHNGQSKHAVVDFVKVLHKQHDLLNALALDFLQRVTLGSVRTATPVGRRREGPHRRAIGMPTASQKAGARRAEKAFTKSIFERKLRGGKKLGQLHVHELRAVSEQLINTAASFVQRGYDDAVEGIACILLAEHCVASDPFALLSDVIKPSVAEASFARAGVMAAEAMRDSSALVAQSLLAVAHKPDLITGG